MRAHTPKPAMLAHIVTLALYATSLAGCVSFDDLLIGGDAGIEDPCLAQCRPDAVDCFCADFDGAGDIAEGWVFERNGGGAYATFVEDVRSPPNAVRLTCPGSPDGIAGSAFVVLKRGVQSSARRIRLAGSWKLRPYELFENTNFEFFSVALGSATRVAIGEARGSDSGARPAFSIRVTYMDTAGNTFTDSYPIEAPPTDLSRWVRFELDVTFGDEGTGSFALTWNDEDALTRTDVTTSSPVPGGPETLTASIGGGTLQGLTPDLWMLFDDVVVEVY